jgi:hypothetical protein
VWGCVWESVYVCSGMYVCNRQVWYVNVCMVCACGILSYLPHVATPQRIVTSQNSPLLAPPYLAHTQPQSGIRNPYHTGKKVKSKNVKKWDKSEKKLGRVVWYSLTQHTQYIITHWHTLSVLTYLVLHRRHSRFVCYFTVDYTVAYSGMIGYHQHTTHTIYHIITQSTVHHHTQYTSLHTTKCTSE